MTNTMTRHTPGPWQWFGDPKHGGFYLATVNRGRQYVMDFVRLGMRGAQPRFQVGGLMVDGKDICRFEVAPGVVGMAAAKEEGSGVYRHDITEFDHPDARLIAAAPDLLDALWVCMEHNALHFGESHNTVIQARAAYKKATGK